MTQTPTNSQLSLFLPQLRVGEARVNPSQKGEWVSGTWFSNIAESIDVPPVNDTKWSVSSIPDVWARPLTFQAALFNRNHPLHAACVRQWEAMITALALAEARSFPLKADLVDLEAYLRQEQETARQAGYAQPSIARTLCRLVPSDDAAIYRLNNKNAWFDLYVFNWNGEPVGMTSPTTLICPAEDATWGWDSQRPSLKKLDWFDSEARTLKDPVPYLNDYEKIQLSYWLQELCNVIGKKPQSGNPTSIAQLTDLATQYADRLKAACTDPEQVERLTWGGFSQSRSFFGVTINRGTLTCLNAPIKAPDRPSATRILPSAAAQQLPELILIPNSERIVESWGIPAPEIYIFGSTNLASLDRRKLPTNLNYILEEEVFLPDLYFIDAENAFVGAHLLLGQERLTTVYNGQAITPILPLNPRLLQYLSTADILSNLEVQTLPGSTGLLVSFSLDLKLSGVNGNEEFYRIQRDYALKSQHLLSRIDLPVVEIWPNFKREGWQRYFAFYHASSPDSTFQISVPQAKDVHQFKGVGQFHDGQDSLSDTGSQVLLAELDHFPTYFECRSSKGDLAGVLLLQEPETIEAMASATYRVGIDFGTSFTNVYQSFNELPERLNLEPLIFQVTRSEATNRETIIREYFVASNMRMPFSTVLTTRGAKGTEGCLRDGRVYFLPRLINFFKQGDDWVKSNLKWSPELRSFNQLFLRHLTLHISAQLAKKNVKGIQWCVSYPSAFSRQDIADYLNSWQAIVDELKTTTGLEHIPPSDGNRKFFRTESLAVAQFFADMQKEQLVASACLDIGGGSSDISIWQDNSLIHQCSVQLAGRHLFSELLEKNPGFLYRMFRENAASWELRGWLFYVKLDFFMTQESAGWLKNVRHQKLTDPEFRGLMQLMALGLGGLYYYIGLLLKALHQEGKYTCAQATPVYLAGNGARLVNWLANNGQLTNYDPINAYFADLLSLASGFESYEAYSRMTPRPKDEVACGLVLDQTRLKGMDKKQADDLIAGESFELNGQEYSWESRMTFPKQIESFNIAQLQNLASFLNHYHRAVEANELEDLLPPVEGYTVTDDLAENDALWQPVYTRLRSAVLNLRGETDKVRIEPPFILAVKALLTVLGNRWAEKFKNS